MTHKAALPATDAAGNTPGRLGTLLLEAFTLAKATVSNASYLLGIANDEREKAASLHTSINKVSPFTQPKV